MADIDSNLPTKDITDGTPGTTPPALAEQVAGTDGSNLRVLSVDTTGKLNINNISGTVSLPTGAATSALQTTGNTSVASIDTKTPTLGQKTMANSSPVVLASDQTSISTTSKVPLTPSAPATATIGITSGTILAANAARKGLIITNTSTLGVLSLNIVGGSAVALSGIVLYPHDSWYMDEYSFTTSQIDGIASLAGTTVGIQELT